MPDGYPHTYPGGLRRSRGLNWPSGRRSDRSISIDVVRGADLVALAVEFFEVGLSVEAGTPVIRAVDETAARMIVGFSYQHGQEAAQFVTDPGGPATYEVVDGFLDRKHPITPPLAALSRPVTPVAYQPARASRLTFRIGPDDRIEFTRTGILAAIRTLEPILPQAARPSGAAGAVSASFDTRPSLLWVGPDLIGRYTGAGLVIAAATAADRRALPAPATRAEAAEVFARNMDLIRNVGGTVRVESGHSLTAGLRDLLGSKRVVQLPGGPRLPIPIPPIRDEWWKHPGAVSLPPRWDETAIEAPYRLVIAPSQDGVWTHADGTVDDGAGGGAVELWHSRLATRVDGAVDEGPRSDRIVRAVWTRDRDLYPNWIETDPPVTPSKDDPFQATGSLTPRDRNCLVRQTSEHWPGIDEPRSVRPVAADRLWLSALGAWLDLHGAWYTKEYSASHLRAKGGLSSILAWDHIAPQGRDQYVRVVYPGYLYPLGHAAALVKVTERQVSGPGQGVDAGPTASLYQRMYIVVSERSRDYPDTPAWPFSRVDLGPATSPPILKPSDEEVFWPRLAETTPVMFDLRTTDRVGREQVLRAPLLWVAESVSPLDGRIGQAYIGADPSWRNIAAHGQRVGFTRDTGSVNPTQALRFTGTAAQGDSVPRLESADITVEAAARLAATPPLTVRYRVPGPEAGDQRDAPWPSAAVSDDVWAVVDAKTAGKPEVISFGTPAAGSDRAGGFVTPNLPARFLSCAKGAVGTPKDALDGSLQDPAAFFAGALPRLFGLVDLAALIAPRSPLPAMVTEQLTAVAALVQQIDRGTALAAQLAADAPGKVLAEANALRAQLESLAGLLSQAVGAGADPKIPELTTAVTDARNALATLLSEPELPLQGCSALKALDGALAAATDIATVINAIGAHPSFRYEFRPTLKTTWKLPTGATVLELEKDGFTLSVTGEVTGNGTVTMRSSAELRNVTLHLIGTEDENFFPLMRVKVKNISFVAGTSGKPEIDVKMGEIAFLGILGFVDRLRRLIPLDGFSDPPFVDVDTSGARAGFTQAIPNLAIGVFNLSNVSLGADVQIPFLGKSLSVGFNFCTRERPFALTVLCLGGGGWFVVRLAPDRLTLLEAGLEATAALAVDFGVASGSISASIGVYLRLEGDGGQLAAYFRMRGEVSVLGLISASIELYLELSYDFHTGKLVGYARITVQVSVAFFSQSVSIECRRQFAGSNGDPTLAEQVLEADRSAPAWDEYWNAFAVEGL
ncbi:hypothetical protein [Tsukamurella pseudospumae]|uniref:hypothetical protein n=1 Tax=Tsukamurella pseudospumae TaxID=239498 RepID=UPI000A7A7B59|nr:hypothetical protein [Tsukamurella pseudospumae]